VATGLLVWDLWLRLRHPRHVPAGDGTRPVADPSIFGWIQTGAGISAAPIAYEIDGREYVAVASEGNFLFWHTAWRHFSRFRAAEALNPMPRFGPRAACGGLLSAVLILRAHGADSIAWMHADPPSKRVRL